MGGFNSQISIKGQFSIWASSESPESYKPIKRALLIGITYRSGSGETEGDLKVPGDDVRKMKALLIGGKTAFCLKALRLTSNQTNTNIRKRESRY